MQQTHTKQKKFTRSKQFIQDLNAHHHISIFKHKEEIAFAITSKYKIFMNKFNKEVNDYTVKTINYL